MGWEYSSDGRKFNLGLNYYNKENMIGNIEFGKHETGDESITLNPYDAYSDYLTEPSPSGVVNETIYASGRLQWWWKPNIQLFAGLEWLDSNMNARTISFNLRIV